MSASSPAYSTTWSSGTQSMESGACPPSSSSPPISEPMGIIR